MRKRNGNRQPPFRMGKDSATAIAGSLLSAWRNGGEKKRTVAALRRLIGGRKVLQ